MKHTMAPLLFALLTVFAACGRQAEGEQCNTAADDCTSGLVCTKRTLLQGATQDRCCPTDLSRASTAACKGVSLLQPNVVDDLFPLDAGSIAADANASPIDASGTTATTDASDARSAADAR